METSWTQESKSKDPLGHMAIRGEHPKRLGRPSPGRESLIRTRDDREALRDHDRQRRDTVVGRAAEDETE